MHRWTGRCCMHTCAHVCTVVADVSKLCSAGVRRDVGCTIACLRRRPTCYRSKRLLCTHLLTWIHSSIAPSVPLHRETRIPTQPTQRSATTVCKLACSFCIGLPEICRNQAIPYLVQAVWQRHLDQQFRRFTYSLAVVPHSPSVMTTFQSIQSDRLGRTSVGTKRQLQSGLDS